MGNDYGRAYRHYKSENKKLLIEIENLKEQIKGLSEAFQDYVSKCKCKKEKT